MVPGSGRNWIAVKQSDLDKKMKTKNMTTLPSRNSIGRLPLRRGFLLIPLALAWFTLSPTTQAQLLSPTPDGGYPNNNTAEGTNALFSNTTGGNNTASGFNALLNNTTGGGNTANGAFALFSNTNGFQNTANGVVALASNTTGTNNTANGVGALNANTTGNENTANGVSALQSNTIGTGNTASGYEALKSNTTVNNVSGNFNTANGINALFSNTIGNSNTANGANALESNTTGFDNTASGAQALRFNTGSSNIALGTNAGINLTTGDYNIDIGAHGVAGEGNTIRVGRAGFQKAAYMQGISGATVASGVTVIVGSNGHLGTVTSSARFKEAIKPMDNASEAILALQPVTFRYKHELDPDGIPQFGLVAEQVEKVNPDLVVRDADGKINTVRYEAVNAMLLNEFLKEHRKVEEQGAVIAQQQKNFESKITQQQKQIEALTAVVQKVSAQVDLNRPAPQIVLNNQ